MASRSFRRGSAAAALVMTLVLQGCAGRQDPGGRPRSPGPDSDVSTTIPSPSSPFPTPTPLLVTPRPGLVDVRPNPWEKAEVLDERTVEVRFWGGVQDCYGVDRVDVAYETSRITVTVFQGRVPTAEACIEIAVLTAVRVKLKEPLDGRTIVDGAPGAE